VALLGAKKQIETKIIPPPLVQQVSHPRCDQTTETCLFGKTLRNGIGCSKQLSGKKLSYLMMKLFDSRAKVGGF
jgi:hypothetical protein